MFRIPILDILRSTSLTSNWVSRGQLEQHHLTRVAMYGASSHGELKTLAIIIHAFNDTHGVSCDHQLHVHIWVVVNAAVDFQIKRRLAQRTHAWSQKRPTCGWHFTYCPVTV